MQLVDHVSPMSGVFDSAPREMTGEVATVDGVLPALSGTAYWNGPALFERGGRRQRHWLDGDGMVLAVRFSASGVSVSSRYVRGPKFDEEEARGQFLYRTFGTSFEGDKLARGRRLESPSNVSVLHWRDQLLALGEQGLPVRMDPATLTTHGPFDFEGQVGIAAPFSAHPHVGETGELFNFGMSYSQSDARLNVYRFSPAGKLVYRSRIPVDRPYSIHDFGLGPTHAWFHMGPYELDLQDMVRPGGTLMGSLHWNAAQRSWLLGVDRATGEACARIELTNPSRHVLHHVGTHVDGSDHVVDVIEWPRPAYAEYQVLPNLFEHVPTTDFVRYVLRPNPWRVVERVACPLGRAVDFPTMAGVSSASPLFWALGISSTGQRGPKFLDELLSVDRENGCIHQVYRSAGFLCGDPLVVGDRDPHVLCVSMDPVEMTSSVLIFRGHDLAAGPVATVRLPARAHLPFHATFVPSGGSSS